MTQFDARHALITIAIVALVAWRMYGRIRRVIGRQRFSNRRPWTTVIIWPLIAALLLYVSRNQLLIEECFAGGLAVGIALALLGLRLTRFEVTPEGLFYTPNMHLGIALSTLLAARIAYRFLVTGFPGSSTAPVGNGLTPLTMLLVGTLAGYYVTYAVGLLRWHSQAPAPVAPGAAPPSS
jgi:hypothetical protein